jgi:hypothetical protein
MRNITTDGNVRRDSYTTGSNPQYFSKQVNTDYVSDADRIKKLEKEIENIKRCLLVNGIVCGENDNDL